MTTRPDPTPPVIPVIPAPPADLVTAVSATADRPPPAADRPLPYYEAASMIGVEIDPARLQRETRTRACGCVENAGEVPDAEWTHCPYCGKALYATRVELIDEWDSRDPGRPLLCGFLVMSTAPPDTPGLEKTSLGRLAMRQGVRMIVGDPVARTDLGHLAQRVDAVSGDVVRERLERALAPLGLWDPKGFGLWAILCRVR